MKRSVFLFTNKLTNIPLLKVPNESLKKVWKDFKDVERLKDNFQEANSTAHFRQSANESPSKLLYSQFGLTRDNLESLDNLGALYETLVAWKGIPVSSVLLKHVALSNQMSKMLSLNDDTQTNLRHIATSIRLGQNTLVRALSESTSLEKRYIWLAMLLPLLTRLKNRTFNSENAKLYIDTIWITPKVEDVLLLKSFCSELLSSMSVENRTRAIQFTTGDDDLKQAQHLLQEAQPFVLVGTPHRILELCLSNSLNCPNTFILADADQLVKYPETRVRLSSKLYHYHKHPRPILLLVDLLRQLSNDRRRDIQFCLQGYSLSSSMRRFLSLEKHWFTQARSFTL